MNITQEGNMMRDPKNDKLIGVNFTLKDGSTKFVKNMTINQQEIDLERAIELLKESVYLINIIPNKRYDGPLYEKSYELASNIDKFLNQIDEK